MCRAHTPQSCTETTKATAELELAPEAVARLKERAKGHPLPEFISRYAANLLETELRRPSFDEFLEPVPRAFEASGITEDDFNSRIRGVINRIRDRRPGTSS